MIDERQAFEAGYRWGYGNGHYDGEHSDVEGWDDDARECYDMWVGEDGRKSHLESLRIEPRPRPASPLARAARRAVEHRDALRALVERRNAIDCETAGGDWGASCWRRVRDHANEQAYIAASESERGHGIYTPTPAPPMCPSCVERERLSGEVNTSRRRTGGVMAGLWRAMRAVGGAP